MSAISVLNDAGVQASIEQSGGLKLRGLSRLSAEQKEQIINYARNHKPVILAALNQNGEPGQCESCPAAGYWDHSAYAGCGLICFHQAYYLGKPGKPSPCTEIRNHCPRNELPLPSSRQQ